jgi:hypothetical protein
MFRRPLRASSSDLTYTLTPQTPDFARATMMCCRHGHHFGISSYKAVCRNRSIFGAV